MNLGVFIGMFIAATGVIGLTADLYRTRHDRRLDRLVRKSEGRR